MITMTINITGTNKAYDVTLRAWIGDQYEPDCFGDLETNTCDGAEMTQEDFDHLVEWWQREVDDYNNGEPSLLGDPDDEYYEEAKRLRPEYMFAFEEV